MLKHVRRDTIPHLSGAPAGHLEDASSRRGRRSHGRPRSGTNHPSSKASERRCLAPRAALPRVPARDKLDSFGQILAAQGTPVPAGDPISPQYLRKGSTIYEEARLRTPQVADPGRPGPLHHRGRGRRGRHPADARQPGARRSLPPTRAADPRHAYRERAGRPPVA